MAARRVLLFLFLIPALSPVRSPAANTVEAELAACTASFASDPQSRDSAKCFFLASKGPEAREPTIRRLEDLRTRYPGRPWLLFYLGHLRWTEPETAEALFREAAEQFAAQGDGLGEIFTRDSRELVLMRLGKTEEADREVARAVQVARAMADPSLVLRTQLLEVRHLLAQRKDVERAYFLIRRATAAAFPGEDYDIQRDCLLHLGNASMQLGRIHEAREVFRRLSRLANSYGDRLAEATASYNLTRSLTDEIVELPREGVRREAIASARQALAAAEASGHRSVEAKAHLVLGMLSPDPESRGHLEHCAEAAPSPVDKSYCLEILARRVVAEDPVRANALVEQALALAEETGDPDGLAAAWRERMRVAWRTAPLERAALSSWSALRTIEALRESRSGPVSPERLATGAEDYYWLSGRLLEAGSRDLVDLAFDVTERMRSRALIGALEVASARPAETEEAVHLREKRAATLGEIAGIQRRLFDPGVPTWEKAEAQHELERLELEEADLRHQLTQASPAVSSLLRPDFVSLQRLRHALDADEALLSFQVAPWKDYTGDFGGGSWLLVATRNTTRVYRLMDRMELRPAVALFTGLFEARNGGEAASCAGLYRTLLAPALRNLPPGIRRLVIVPDDALHKLPFGALRESPEARPLALRYEISMVPSATLWLRWQENRPGMAPVPALAFADPPLPGGSGGNEVRPAPAPERAAAAIFTSGIRLGPLPYAREESRALVRDLGGDSTRRLGEEASEAFLKSHALKTYGILHFATHAVTDEANPDRSGVLLAPGDSHQDGLLQIREIVDLDLKGRVVVLSACSSNTGALLRGEGVMSLARAFFQAGAHTVVASLWRLRDDEAADFFDRFYRHIGQGVSVAAALQAAQGELITDGAPAAAWAGLVVLGDGDMVPLPGGRKETRVPLWAWALGGTGGLLGLVAIWSLRRSSRM